MPVEIDSLWQRNVKNTSEMTKCDNSELLHEVLSLSGLSSKGW